MTDYLWEPIGLLVDQMEDVRKLRNHPLGDGSLDALELELMERTKVFWTPHMICANPLYCSFEKLGATAVFLVSSGRQYGNEYKLKIST